MNPLLLAKLAPYALAAMVAFGLAWCIQSFRLTNAKQELVTAQQEFTAFKQEQIRIFQEHEENANKQREKSALAYEASQKQLRDALADGSAWQRCVMAGRCSNNRAPAGVCKPATTSAVQPLRASTSSDAAPSDEVPAASGDASGLVQDCAMTTLQLISLQADIEAQPGYKE